MNLIKAAQGVTTGAGVPLASAGTSSGSTMLTSRVGATVGTPRVAAAVSEVIAGASWAPAAATRDAETVAGFISVQVGLSMVKPHT